MPAAAGESEWTRAWGRPVGGTAPGGSDSSIMSWISNGRDRRNSTHTCKNTFLVLFGKVLALASSWPHT